MPDPNSAAASEPIDSQLFLSRPNRSLSQKGRLIWLALITAATMSSALAATAIGAWMALPFAGLEVILVWFAFCTMARHDGDYEFLKIAGQEFCWERCSAGKIHRLCGNRLWARATVKSGAGRCEIFLRYGGNEFRIGEFMSGGQMQRLSVEISSLFQREVESG